MKKTSPFKPRMTSTPETFPKMSGMMKDISRIKWSVHALGDVLIHNITDEDDVIEDNMEKETAVADMELVTNTTTTS